MVLRAVRAGVAFGLLLAVVVAVPPSVARAESEVPAGTYRIQYADGESATWDFAPCGPDCTVANAQVQPPVINWQFQLADGRWTYSGPNELSCPSGGTVPIAFVYGFDPVTLAGQGQATLAIETCGAPAGKTMVRTFQLTKLG